MYNNPRRTVIGNEVNYYIRKKICVCIKNGASLCKIIKPANRILKKQEFISRTYLIGQILIKVTFGGALIHL